MNLDRPLGNRKAQPGTTAVARPRFVHAKEAMEDALPVLRRDPRPLVFDGQNGLVSGPLDAESNPRPGRAVLDRVIEHIRDRLAQHQTIRRHDHAIGDVEDKPLIALLREDPERAGNLSRQLPEIDRPGERRIVSASPRDRRNNVSTRFVMRSISSSMLPIASS